MTDRLAIIVPRYLIGFVIGLPIVLGAVYFIFGLKAYIDALSVVALVIAIVSIAASAFMVGLVLEENVLARETGRPLGWRRLTLTRVLTVATVIVQVFALYIGILAGLRLAGSPPLTWTAPISATVFVALEGVPLLFAGYLAVLRRRRRHQLGRATPPPYGPED